MTFLVADDDADDRLLITDAFEESEANVSVDTVADGEEPIHYLRRTNGYKDLKDNPLPAVILLDLNMPRKDGATALKEIKEDPRLQRIPVVVLTTSRSEDDVDRLYELGASSFITKPLNYDRLRELANALTQYWSDFVTLPTGAAHG